MKTARAFAPATVANVAVGFDILGFAIQGLGEIATVEIAQDSRTVTIEPVAGHPSIPTDPLKNTATAGLVRLIAERKLGHGFRVRLEKNIPVGSGLGGSSASAVAAIVAANACLKKKLSDSELLDYALTGEAVASGARHADNVGPCLRGGLVLVRSALSVTKVKTPTALRCVVILPGISVNTRESRGILKSEVPLLAMVEQTGNLAGFVLGCATGDIELIGECLRDVVIEPQRARLIPAFSEMQTAALASGALGCSISGSGPAVFALVANAKAASRVERAMLAALAKRGVPLKGSWISPIAKRGARLVR